MIYNTKTGGCYAGNHRLFNISVIKLYFRYNSYYDFSPSILEYSRTVLPKFAP